jgi:hypothetical protein
MCSGMRLQTPVSRSVVGQWMRHANRIYPQSHLCSHKGTDDPNLLDFLGLLFLRFLYYIKMLLTLKVVIYIKKYE